MNRDKFIHYVKNNLHQQFSAGKAGHKSSDQERNRLEGYMHAGIHIGLVTKQELNELMESVHQTVFYMTTQERLDKQTIRWQPSIIDYNHYDIPTVMRKGAPMEDE
tara:strand:+ start:660 stop:977 length:318 start_codon:yes stop_codon:yes gene_type:complete